MCIPDMDEEAPVVVLIAGDEAVLIDIIFIFMFMAVGNILPSRESSPCALVVICQAGLGR